MECRFVELTSPVDMNAKWIDELEKANTAPNYDDENEHYSADDNLDQDRDEDLDDYCTVCSTNTPKKTVAFLLFTNCCAPPRDLHRHLIQQVCQQRPMETDHDESGNDPSENGNEYASENESETNGHGSKTCVCGSENATKSGSCSDDFFEIAIASGNGSESHGDDGGDGCNCESGSRSGFGNGDCCFSKHEAKPAAPTRG